MAWAVQGARLIKKPTHHQMMTEAKEWVSQWEISAFWLSVFWLWEDMRTYTAIISIRVHPI